MNRMRSLLYICALITFMPYVHAEDIVLHEDRIEICHPGNYQIRYLNDSLALVDCDNEQRFYGLQAAIQPGGFSLPANITSQFTIAANQVQIDLSGHKVQGGIVVAPNRSDVQIANGLIGGKFASSLTNGILVASGCKNITLSGLQVTNATTGINFNNVTVGLINNCDLSQNSIGVLLQSSSQITIQNSVALNSTNIGFELISSSSCIVQDSRALSTGQGNVQSSGATICGFLTNNGNSNIFENCIANGTQGLSVTDFDSLVSGFAFLGTENCSKITGCEASNGTTSIAGFNVPYGIFLQGGFSTALTLTGAPPMPAPTALVNAMVWSPDTQYLAVGGNAGILTIYKFNRVTGVFASVATTTLQVSGSILTIDWHPDGQHIAVSANASPATSYINIYSFSSINNTLTLVATQNNQNAADTQVFIAWQPSGKFLASVEGTSVNKAYAYQFNSAANTLTLLGAGATLAANPFEISWSPDGNYLAIAEFQVYEVYSFIQSTAPQFSLNASAVQGVSPFDARVAWSPDGKYLAIGKDDSTNANLIIYSFSPGTLTLQAAAGFGSAGNAGSFMPVAWSNDSRYVVGGHHTLLEIFEFNRSASALTPTAFSIVSTNISRLAWSKDGGLLALADNAVSPFLFLYTALSFPSQNVIKNNTVYCNSGGSIPSGIGISGSSVSNMIIQNNAYSNPINPFMISTNYAFAQNVYNQLFGAEPTGVQNISVGYRDPIVNQDNLALLARQINSQLSNQTFSSMNVIQSVLSTLMTTTLSGGPCAPTPIFQVNLPTTIGTSGSYCLGQNVSLASQVITVTVDNVVIDLNNHKITNTSTSPAININSGARNNIVIKNGYIEQTMTGTAIAMTTGGNNLTLQDLIVKTNGGTAVACTNVNNGLIKNCTFTNSLIGALLTNCVGINFENSQTRDCSLKGFELISSVTCSFINCKAISTGAGNTQTSNQVIAGFHSTMGSGNVFENCIANGTQGLSITDFESVVAGFMLTGTETYSKIIGCESSNNIVGPNSYSVPYGIFLENVVGPIYPVSSAEASSGGISEISWSPNGKYLIVSDIAYNRNDVYLYKFDRLTRSLIQLAVLENYVFSESLASSWSPDGQYVAVGLGNLIIYKFDQTTESLTEIVQLQLAEPPYSYDLTTALAWSPDSTYLAVGSGRFDGIKIIKVDRVAQTFTTVASHSFGGQNYELDWSPDGQYLAVGTFSFQVFNYFWDRVNNQLVLKDSKFTPGYNGIRDLRWSPDGQYLAIAAVTDLYIYSLNKTTGVLTNILATNPGGYFGTLESVRWSPDGKYLLIGGDPTGYPTANDAFIYEFNRQTITLNLQAAVNPASGQVLSVAWSPDGDYLALGRKRTPGNDLFIYTAFNFPQNCVIKNNVTYCNTGGVQSRGVGISGSSASNLIVGNTSYSNPTTPFMVNENYHFVTNVFNPLFENTPGLFENISLGYQQVIPTPDNEALLADQLIAAVNTLGLCGPTALNLFNIVNGTISLSVSGYYCLSQDLTTDISITNTCIVLDLNSRALTGSIYITTSDDVIVKNGFVTPPTYAPSSNVAPPAAVNVYNSSVRTTISGLNIVCANSSTDPASDGIAGRTGIYIEGIDTIVRDCYIVAGSGSPSTNATPGGNGGNGIELSSTATAVRPIITNCVIYATGNGGSGSSGAPSSSGGNGGFGIKVGNSLNASIQSVTVFSTGNGGNGFGAGHTAGNGGHAIEVLATAIGTEVLNCILRNTGTVGTASSGATAGLNGKAVDDHVTVTANLSKVFSNFAHDIASATKFDLQASGFERGTLIPNPPGQSVFNILANVFTSQ